MLKPTGIMRKIDDLGRVVLPKELRKYMDIQEGDSLEIYTDEDAIVLKKYQPADIFTGDMSDLIEYKGKKVSINTIKELARIAGFTVTEKKRTY